jgi:hypothetical protein
MIRFLIILSTVSESINIVNLLIIYHIIGCFIYVGGVLIGYSGLVTNINSALCDFNNVRTEFKFTLCIRINNEMCF